MAGSEQSDRISVAIGIALLAAYLGQAWLELEWTWVARVQADDTYKVCSGLVLAGYLLRQSFMGRRRLRNPIGVLFWHKLGGALAPLVLYVHASRFAYGYLLLLGWMYLGTALLGLLHRRVLRSHARKLFTVWFIVHVTTSASLVVLSGYHVVIALAYE
jgi:hypothetical protein